MKLCTDQKVLDHLSCREVVAAWGQITGFTHKYRNDCRCSVINQVSRATIRAMRPCFIVKVNLHGDERKKKDHILTEYRMGMVFNFAGSLVIPARDEKLADLIHARDMAEYTGTADDMKRITEIYDHAAKIGAKTLHWD